MIKMFDEGFEHLTTNLQLGIDNQLGFLYRLQLKTLFWRKLTSTFYSKNINVLFLL